jgi:hypothetical protein
LPMEMLVSSANTDGKVIRREESKNVIDNERRMGGCSLGCQHTKPRNYSVSM